MKILTISSIINALLITVGVVFAIWVELNSFFVKILITLFVLFIAQIVAYLVIRDLQEESTGKSNGVIAK